MKVVYSRQNLGCHSAVLMDRISTHCSISSWIP